MGRGVVARESRARARGASRPAATGGPYGLTPASDLVNDALRHSVLRGLAAWQLFPAFAAFASSGTTQPLLVVSAHLALAVLLLFCSLRRLSPLPCLLATYALVAVDYAAADDAGGALAFAAVWTASLTCATPILLARDRIAVVWSLCAIAVLTSAQIVLRPEWPVAARLIVIVNALILLLGVRAMARTMRVAAGRTDAQADLAQRAAHREHAVVSTGRALAEDARIIHDTALNTLGAIAGDAGGRVGLRMVRDRCARDAAVLRELGRGGDGSLELGPAALGRQVGIAVEFPGSSLDEFERLEALLPERVSVAIRRAIAELIMNAAAHSGADRVTIDAAVRDGCVVITVSDAGSGFDGRPISGRGIAESVIERCRSAGVAVDLRTAPGQGTRVTLSYRPGGEDALDHESRPDAGTGSSRSGGGTGAGLDAAAIGRTGYWPAAATILLADLALSAVRTPSAAVLSLANTGALGVLLLLAWSRCRGGRKLPPWLTVLIVGSVPIVFCVSFLTTVTHGARMIELQAILLVAPLSVLLATHRSRAPMWAALAALGLAVVAACGILLSIAPQSALLPLIAVCPQLGLFAGLLSFQTMLSAVVAQHETERRRTLDAEARTGAQAALALARKRWVLVGARASAELLRRIADGELDPRDLEVRERCGEEERYLRQLLSIDVELRYLSPWLAFALAEARARHVPLRIRSGTLDAPDPETARVFGQALLAAVEACGPGDPLSAGLFSERGEPVCLVLGPPSIAERVRGEVAAHRRVAYEITATHALITLRPSTAEAPSPAVAS